MKRKILFGAVCFFMLFSLCLPHQVIAQTAPTYSWIWKVDFVGAKTQAVLVLHKRVKGIVVKEALVDFSETCIPIGSVRVQNSTAHFNGNGYIECMLPSVADAFNTHYGVSVPSVVTSASAWASVDLMGPTVGPVFGYDTLALDVEFQSDFATSTLDLNGTLTQQTYQGQNYNQPNLMHQLWIGHEAGQFLEHIWTYPTLGTWAKSYTQYPHLQPGTFPSQDIVYLHNGTWQNTTQQVSPVSLRTSSIPLYIGFNPNSGQLLRGALKSVGGDPGCRCH